jgi:ribonuclease I
VRELNSRPEGEQMFFIIHGYWPENGTELPQRMEFTARGIKTMVTAEWED